jgi:hypothetical protein
MVEVALNGKGYMNERNVVAKICLGREPWMQLLWDSLNTINEALYERCPEMIRPLGWLVEKRAGGRFKLQLTTTNCPKPLELELVFPCNVGEQYRWEGQRVTLEALIDKIFEKVLLS